MGWRGLLPEDVVQGDLLVVLVVVPPGALDVVVRPLDGRHDLHVPHRQGFKVLVFSGLGF